MAASTLRMMALARSLASPNHPACYLSRRLYGTEDMNLIMPDALRVDEVNTDGFSISNVQVEGAVVLTGEPCTWKRSGAVRGPNGLGWLPRQGM